MVSPSNGPAPARSALPRRPPRLPWRRVLVFALASLALHAWLLRDAARWGVGTPAARGIEVVGVTLLPGATQPVVAQAAPLPVPAPVVAPAPRPRPRPARPAVVPRPAAIASAPSVPAAVTAEPGEPAPAVPLGTADGMPEGPAPVDRPDGALADAALPARDGPQATGPADEGASADRVEGGDADRDAAARAAADADAALPGAPPLPPPPAQAVWRYRVYSGDYLEDRQIASMDYRFGHDGRRYRFELAGRAEGLTAWLYSGALVQVSEGTIGAAGLQPERYAEQRGKRAERSLSVDRARRELIRGDDPRLPVPPGAQDRLSTLVQLGLIARAMPDRVAAGAVLELPELSFSGVETVRYRSAGRVMLALPGGGEMPALHLVRERGASDREPGVEVWLGYDHALLPVRVRLTDTGGRVLDQFLQGS